MFTAALAADVILASTWMAICLMVPVLAGRKKQTENLAEVTTSGAEMKPVTLERTLYSSGRAIALVHAAGLAA